VPALSPTGPGARSSSRREVLCVTSAEREAGVGAFGREHSAVEVVLYSGCVVLSDVRQVRGEQGIEPEVRWGIEPATDRDDVGCWVWAEIQPEPLVLVRVNPRVGWIPGSGVSSRSWPRRFTSLQKP
jgi:hypothetical protein